MFGGSTFGKNVLRRISRLDFVFQRTTICWLWQNFKCKIMKICSTHFVSGRSKANFCDILILCYIIFLATHLEREGGISLDTATVLAVWRCFDWISVTNFWSIAVHKVDHKIIGCVDTKIQLIVIAPCSQCGWELQCNWCIYWWIQSWGSNSSFH